MAKKSDPNKASKTPTVGFNVAPETWALLEAEARRRPGVSPHQLARQVLIDWLQASEKDQAMRTLDRVVEQFESVSRNFEGSLQVQVTEAVARLGDHANANLDSQTQRLDAIAEKVSLTSSLAGERLREIESTMARMAGAVSSLHKSVQTIRDAVAE